MKDPSVSGSSPQEQLNNKGDFARLLNLIPQDKARWLPDPSVLLWNELKRLLIDSTTAESTLTPEENELLEKAIDFLTDSPDDEHSGIPVPSKAYREYIKYQDAFNALQHKYFEEKLVVENATGPEGDKLRKQWQEQKKNEWQSILEKTMQDWVNLGFKSQVEYYQSQRNSLETKNNTSSYKQLYLREIELSQLSDLSTLAPFCITFFSPIDAFDTDSLWTSVTLTKGEIESLALTAPEELRTLFASGQDTKDIEFVSLEYKDVAIIRPWFKPEFFESRFWKLSEDAVISDGKIPRNGRVPAYVDRMIVARNMKITRRKSEAQQEPIKLKIFGGVALDTLKQKTIIDHSIKPIDISVAERTKPVEIPTNMRVLSLQTTTDRSSSFVRIGSDLSPRLDIPLEEWLPRFNSEVNKKYAEAKYNGTPVTGIEGQIQAIRYLNQKEITENEPQHDATVDHNLVTETIHFDSIIVLALVCRRVPKSPNPDPLLTWPA